MSKRRSYTAEEKMKILREILEDGKPVSQVADSHGLSPNNIFKWRKQLFEGGVRTFQATRADISDKAEERRVAALEATVTHKDRIIAELAGEPLELKKNHCGRSWERPR